MNNYNKVRATLTQMMNLRTAIDQLIKDCEQELARQPIDTSKTVEELKLELELDELQDHFEQIQADENKPDVQRKRVVIDSNTLAEINRQKLFEDRERIIKQMKQIKPTNKGD